MKKLLFAFCGLMLAFSASAQSLDDLLKKALDPNTNSKDLEKAFQNTADAQNKATGTGGYEKVTDQGIVHDLHRQNLGKIVFSNQEIGKATTSSTNFKTSFSSLSGGVYGQVYLEKSLRNYRADLGASTYGRGYWVEYYADGKLISTASNNSLDSDEDEQWTTWQVIPAPAASDDYTCENTHAFAEGLKKVTAGKHQFKAVLYVVYGEPHDLNTSGKKEIASGTFDLTFTDADKKAFVDEHEYKYAEPGTYTSSSSSSSSSGFAATVNIIIENKSGVNISKLEVDTDGSGRTVTSLSNGNSTSFSRARVGGNISVNGKVYRSIGAGDKDQRIIIY